MAVRLSRAKLAKFTAERLLKGQSKQKVFQEVAAYLIDTGRVREAELLVRDIEAALAEKGVVVADVTSAHPLMDALKKEVGQLVKADSLQLRETVDVSVLGGLRIDLPGKRYDGTLRRRLDALKAKKV